MTETHRLQECADRLADIALEQIAAFIEEHRRIPQTADVTPTVGPMMAEATLGLTDAEQTRVAQLLTERWTPRLAATLARIAAPLTRWSCRGTDGDAYFGGRDSAGMFTTTSRIMERVAPLTYLTMSGSLYRLDGPPDPGFAEYLGRRGIPLDLADPIKFRDRPA